jgi:hypothetical protein
LETREKVEQALELLTELSSILESEYVPEIEYALREIGQARDWVECIFCQAHVSEAELDLLLVRLEQMLRGLYPPRGGLTEFYVWKTDKMEMSNLNHRLKEVQDRLWSLLVTKASQ